MRAIITTPAMIHKKIHSYFLAFAVGLYC
jgi:hypothetical protein